LLVETETKFRRPSPKEVPPLAMEALRKQVMLLLRLLISLFFNEDCVGVGLSDRVDI